VQSYLDGFYPGDPEVLPAAREHSTRIPEAVDVLIVGSGPAGLVLGAQLAAFPEISTRIVERNPGPLLLGRADGIACRTVEMFQAFGFSERLVREAYWVNETAFWRPDPNDRTRIVRTGRVQDVEDDLSECPHVILNQARVHDYLLETMQRSPSRLEPDYGIEVSGVAVDHAPGIEHPVRVDYATGDGERSTIRARYVVGCDGARSSVRTAIGRELLGDLANHAWGVMDILAVSNFPDIRLKAAIQSDEHGNVLLIPREGGYLVRLYVARQRDAPHPTRSSPSRNGCFTRTRSTFETSCGSRSTRSDNASPIASTTLMVPRILASSSPATPAIPTARRPGRA
jgi:phenol 2-monooxygenase